MALGSRELISGFADYVLDQELGGQRYCDPTIEPRDDPASIMPSEVDALRGMMMALMQQSDQFDKWFGEFILQSSHELDLALTEPPYQTGEINDLLNQGESLYRVGGLRVLLVGADSYVNGEKIVMAYCQAVAALSARYDISREQLGDAMEPPPSWRCCRPYQ